MSLKGASQSGARITGAITNLFLIKEKASRHSKLNLKSLSLTKRLLMTGHLALFLAYFLVGFSSKKEEY